MPQAKKNSQEINKTQTLVMKLGESYGVDPLEFLDTLKATAFKQSNGIAPTNEQMMALLVVADQYSLNPFTKEIYAFPDRNNGIVPVVGIDGWSRIINNNKHFDGVDFRYSENLHQIDEFHKPCHAWIECIIYRSDRSKPMVVREYLDEVYKPPVQRTSQSGPYVINGPWQTHTKRMLRHKVLIQCARVALGYTGIYDQDEAENIIAPPPEVEVSGEVVSSELSLSTEDQKVLEKLSTDLIDRASSEGTWQAAKDWVIDRLEGNKQEYVLNKINLAQEESSKNYLTDEEGFVDESLDCSEVSESEFREGDLTQQSQLIPETSNTAASTFF